MAQGYRCDWPDHDAPAEVVITMLGNGDVSAYCGLHFVQTMRDAIAINDEADAEADQAAADATAALDASISPLAGRRVRRATRDEPTGEDVPGEATPGPAADAGPVTGDDAAAAADLARMAEELRS